MIILKHIANHIYSLFYYYQLVKMSKPIDITLMKEYEEKLYLLLFLMNETPSTKKMLCFACQVKLRFVPYFFSKQALFVVVVACCLLALLVKLEIY